MWLCEDKLKGKTAHFRLPFASRKRACLSSLIFCPLDVFNEVPSTIWNSVRHVAGTKYPPTRCCSYTNISSHEGTLMSLEHIPGKCTRNIFMRMHMLWFCPCYMSPQCAAIQVFCRCKIPCNTTPRVWPPSKSCRKKWAKNPKNKLKRAVSKYK